MHRRRGPRAPVLVGAALALSMALGTAPAVSGLPMGAGLPETALPVLDPTPLAGSTAPVPTRAGLELALKPVLSDPALGSQVSVVVIDVATGAELLGIAPEEGRVPASTVKLLTATAALELLGPDRPLVTSVVDGGERLVLVGGGDATLALDPVGVTGPLRPASLTELADETVAAIGDRPRVTLAYDARDFSAPYLNPQWNPAYPDLGVVAPITALMVDGGRTPTSGESRVPDPAAYAAGVFADLLRERGLTVRGVEPGGTPAEGAVLASVSSPPMSLLVESMLTQSDNTLAEALAHLAGLETEGTGSFESGAKATSAVLRELGLPSVRLTDGSGLSREDEVPVLTLATVVARAAAGEAPTGWPIIQGLPVAGLTGTLAERFRTPDTQAAAGLVRAKTGTLTGVVGLAGYARSQGGRVLAFAFLVDGQADTDAGRDLLDRAAAAIAACGCR